MAGVLDREGSVVVTGSSGAIGGAVVDGFLDRGFHVIGMDIVAADRRSCAYTDLTVDVRDERELRRAVAAVRPVAHVIGVAGGALAEEVKCQDLDDLDIDTFRRSLDLNLVSQYAVVRALLPSLRSAGCRHRQVGHADRSVTVISSVNALIGMDMPAYSAAKGGLVAMVRTMARLLGPEGIRVNAVAPGTVPTPRTQRIWAHDTDHFDRLRRQSPLGRLTGPEEVAATVCSLAVDLTAVTGQTLVVDAGQTSVWNY